MAAPSVGCPWSAAVAGRPAVRAPLGSSGSSGTWRRRSCWRPAARPQVSSGSSGTWRRRSCAPLGSSGSSEARGAADRGGLRLARRRFRRAPPARGAADRVGGLRLARRRFRRAPPARGAADRVGGLRLARRRFRRAPPARGAADRVGGLRLARRRFRRAPPARGAADRVGGLRLARRRFRRAPPARGAADRVGGLRLARRRFRRAPPARGAADRVGGLRLARRRFRRAPPARGAADRGRGLRFARRWNRRRPPARRAADRPAVRAPLESSASSGTSRRRSACGSRAAGIAGVLRHVAPPIGLRARARQLPPRSRSSAHSRSQRVGASFRRRFWDRSGSSGSPAMKSAHENSDRCGPPPSSSPTATRWPRPPSSAGRRDFCGCGRYERPAGGARLLFGYRVRRTGASGAARTAERRAEHRARSDVRPPAHAERTRAGRPSLRWRFGVLRQGHEWQHAKRSRSRGRGCAQAGLGSGCAGRDVQCAHPRDRLADRAAYTSLGRSLAKAPRGTRRDARGQWCRRTACRCARCSEWRGGHR